MHLALLNNLIYVGHSRSNDRIMNDAMGNIWNEGVVAYFKSSQQNSPRGTEENIGNLQLIVPVYEMKFWTTPLSKYEREMNNRNSTNFFFQLEWSWKHRGKLNDGDVPNIRIKQTGWKYGKREWLTTYCSLTSPALSPLPEQFISYSLTCNSSRLLQFIRTEKNQF